PAYGASPERRRRASGPGVRSRKPPGRRAAQPTAQPPSAGIPACSSRFFSPESRRKRPDPCSEPARRERVAEEGSRRQASEHLIRCRYGSLTSPARLERGVIGRLARRMLVAALYAARIGYLQPVA